MSGPTTEAGRRINDAVTQMTGEPDAILAIEREAVANLCGGPDGMGYVCCPVHLARLQATGAAAYLASPEAAEGLARALHHAMHKSAPLAHSPEHDRKYARDALAAWQQERAK